MFARSSARRKHPKSGSRRLVNAGPHPLRAEPLGLASGDTPGPPCRPSRRQLLPPGSALAMGCCAAREQTGERRRPRTETSRSSPPAPSTDGFSFRDWPSRSGSGLDVGCRAGGLSFVEEAAAMPLSGRVAARSEPEATTAARSRSTAAVCGPSCVFEAAVIPQSTASHSCLPTIPLRRP